MVDSRHGDGDRDQNGPAGGMGRLSARGGGMSSFHVPCLRTTQKNMFVPCAGSAFKCLGGTSLGGNILAGKHSWIHLGNSANSLDCVSAGVDPGLNGV